MDFTKIKIERDVFVTSCGLLLKESTSDVAPLTIAWEKALDMKGIFIREKSVLQSCHVAALRITISNTQDDNIQLFNVYAQEGIIPLFEQMDYDQACKNALSFMAFQSAKMVPSAMDIKANVPTPETLN